MNAILSLNDAVLYNLSCLEQGIESKAVVHQNILNNLSSFIVYWQNTLSLELAEKLHETLGIYFCIHNGMIENIDFGGMK